MGIYIKGMKMPKDDEKIRFVKLLNGKMYALKAARNGFPLSYLHEVIEVTEPHGRLIDAGRILKNFELVMSRRPDDLKLCILPEQFIQILTESKAIIECEGE